MRYVQFAIARVAGQLMRDAGKRELTPDEWRLLHNLSPAMARIEAQEAARGAGKASPGIVHPANGRDGR